MFSLEPLQFGHVEIRSKSRVKLKCEVQDRSKVECVQGWRGHRRACEEGALTAAPHRTNAPVCRNGPAPRVGVNLD